jgi:hypothetical protein
MVPSMIRYVSLSFKSPSLACKEKEITSWNVCTHSLSVPTLQEIIQVLVIFVYNCEGLTIIEDRSLIHGRVKDLFFSLCVPDQLWGPPSLLFPGVMCGRGVTLTTHPYLVPRSRMSRSYTSCPSKRLHGM